MYVCEDIYVYVKTYMYVYTYVIYTLGRRNSKPIVYISSMFARDVDLMRPDSPKGA